MSNSPTQNQVSEADFKAACGRYATGVTVVTAIDAEGQKYGLTVNSFTSLSLDPPLILFCLDKQVSSFEGLTRADQFAVNILSSDQGGVSNHFAKPGVPDKFSSLDYQQGENGLPLLTGTLARLICEKQNIYDGGDHVIITGRVQHIDIGAEDKAPLTYFRGKYGDFSPK